MDINLLKYSAVLQNPDYLKTDYFSKNLTIKLTLIIMKGDVLFDLFKEYLKTIDGIEFVKEEQYSAFGYQCEYNIENKDVDKIVKQITTEDIDFKLL